MSEEVLDCCSGAKKYNFLCREGKLRAAMLGKGVVKLYAEAMGVRL